MLKIKGAFFAFLLLLPIVLQAQEKGFSVLRNTQKLQKALSENAKDTRSISSDFIQVKNMKMLQDKVTSKGKFYFKQADRIRIEYNSPFSYLLIMNGGNITVKDGQKSSRINTRNSKTMQSVNQVMLDCMRGTVFDNADFSVKAFESAREYLLVLHPKDLVLGKMFSGIQVFILKDGFYVSKLVMTENNGDNTEMRFLNTKTNTALADALFFVH